MLKLKSSSLRGATVLPLMAVLTLTAGAFSSALAGDHSYTVLYSFKGGTNGGDGGNPRADLIKDESGNLYGTTIDGGANGSGCAGQGCGTVFELAPAGTETVLHSFNGDDGGFPTAALIRDKAGNLFGTASYGPGDECNGNACGTVFKLAPDGTETVLYAFTGKSDGREPHGGLIEDKKGNLYGMTFSGGIYSYGNIFEVTPKGNEKVLYSFAGGSDGAYPQAGLIADKAGNFYGTTWMGGPDNKGTVFTLAPDGTETVLHSFTGTDGAGPYANLIADKAGNFYSTTSSGGTYNHGTVFKLAPDGTETVLYSFTGGNDGKSPEADLIADKAGNLYGTTLYGGTAQYGAIFKLAPNGAETVLYSFRDGSDGAYPYGGLIADPADEAGYLYGTADTGGTGNDDCGNGSCGVVFEIKK